MKKNRNQASRSSLLRVLGAVGAVALVAFLTLQQANFLLSRGMLIAFGDNEATYKSAWFEWDGDIVAKDVVIYPFDLGEDVTITFDRVHLETPGWFWFVRNTFDRKLKFAKMDRIHLTLEGGRSQTGFDPSLGDLGPFGIDAASPFEAEGCASDGMWLREELAAMGLQTAPPRLEFDYTVDGTALSSRVVLETKGASRVDYQRTAQLPMAINALLIDQYPHRVLSERWEVQDQGFVAARNAYCAKKDGVSVDTFLVRHAATVDRVLEMYGIAVDAATKQAYLAFARNGGTLAFGGDFSPPIEEGQFYELRDLGQAWPRMQNAQVSVGGAASAVQWTVLAPRELAGLEEADSTFAALMRERGGEPLPVAAMGAVQAPQAGVPGMTVTTVSNDTTTTTVASVANETTAPMVASVPDESTTAVASSGTSPPHNTAAASVTDTTASTTARVTPDQPVGATPATPAGTASASAVTSGTAIAATGASPPTAEEPAAAAPRIIPLAPQAPSPSRSYLAWGDMPAYRGQRVRLWTRRNPARLVDVLDADGGSLRISTRVGGGTAEYTVYEDSFLRARALR